MVNDGILDNLEAIKVYPIEIKTEEDLAREIARIANLSLALGYKLEDEGRILSREEAYQQISHSASLFRAVLRYVEGKKTWNERMALLLLLLTRWDFLGPHIMHLLKRTKTVPCPTS